MPRWKAAKARRERFWRFIRCKWEREEVQMKAVILESYVMQPGDLDWSGVQALVPDTKSYF